MEFVFPYTHYNTTYYTYYDYEDVIIDTSYMPMVKTGQFVDLYYCDESYSQPNKRHNKQNTYHHNKKSNFYPKTKQPQFFETEESEEDNSPPVKLEPPEISYERDELLRLSQAPLSKTTPDAWLSIAKKHPRIVKREGPTANIIAKEVRAIKKQEEKNNFTSKKI